jgi:hypothetical protein
MTPHSVFLRMGCILPYGVRLPQEPFCDKWTIVGDMAAFSLDRKIRCAGWHFFWVQVCYSRLGFGRTAKSAIRRALTAALKQVGGSFNAAELGSLQVATYPGLRVAKITLQVRHIQQGTALDSVNKIAPWRTAMQ